MTNDGTLYLVATPIGNLEDITLRAVEALKRADFVAAEDTRRTVKLLNHLGLKKRLLSFHEYSNEARLEEIVRELLQGKSCALVSDAGTPLISDPGYVLVRRCIQAGVPVTSLPGPCAAVTAVTLSGIDCRKFVFAGFLSPKQAARRKELAELLKTGMPVVLYESPNRVVKTLLDICETVGGDTPVCVARELTKLHEEVLHATAREAFLELSERESVKGEFVIVMGTKQTPEDAVTDEEISGALAACLSRGMTKKEAVTFVTANFSVPKNKVYRLLIDL